MDVPATQSPTAAATGAADDPLWYKDAVIYQLHVKAFFDSNGDGLGDFRGRVVFLNFWATWCPPCREEMPAMQALAAELEKQGLVVLALNYEESAETAEAYIRETGLTLPVLDYTHDNGACSIVGGYVYRGPSNASLIGTYFYADFCAGFVRSFRLQNGQLGTQNSWPLLSPPGGRITSFSEDAQGELYLMTEVGELFRIVGN